MCISSPCWLVFIVLCSTGRKAKLSSLSSPLRTFNVLRLGFVSEHNTTQHVQNKTQRGDVKGEGESNSIFRQFSSRRWKLTSLPSIWLCDNTGYLGNRRAAHCRWINWRLHKQLHQIHQFKPHVLRVCVCVYVMVFFSVSVCERVAGAALSQQEASDICAGTAAGNKLCSPLTAPRPRLEQPRDIDHAAPASRICSHSLNTCRQTLRSQAKMHCHYPDSQSRKDNF